ncbi:biotin holocarboxylase synthetase [Arthrobotrys musiformis]|uniref:Biotin holocarboxylase synthetase n=1 Tax=Arthrobotrys musiformis TaxID=47236 RepID=A0AAV9W473_9PEZI
MNVLVYSGPGTSVESVRQCIETLRCLLTPHYAIAPISADAITKEPWVSTCALLCLPGGADLGYCKALNGTGTRILKQYVRRGGKYLGFCAGAYFASARIEFEKGNLSMEVTGNRELGFFPGLCRGAAFKGFQYNSEAGARFCRLDVATKLLNMGAPDNFRSYYNGGGVFLDADRLVDQGIEVLAKYQDKLDIAEEGGNAAVVGCRVGAGYAVLVGAHPEFVTGTPERLQLIQYENSGFPTEWQSNEERRRLFMSAILKYLGLRSNNSAVLTSPLLSDLHLSGSRPREITRLLGSLKSPTRPEGDPVASIFIEAETTAFLLEGHGITPQQLIPRSRAGDDYPTIRVKTYEDDPPGDDETPYFSTLTYFQHLRSYQGQSTKNLSYGSPLLYGELMTSTNSIIDRNFKLLQELPSGFTVVAVRQTAARGRGSNAWVSPLGGLVFSVVVRHSVRHAIKAPAVFIQYLVALSIVKSIKSYDTGYDKIPVYIKWPNDIYVKVATNTPKNTCDYSKIGGILVNANFVGDEFILVIGCGVNVTNEVPTTSLKILAESMDPPLPAYEHEKLLAKILVTFEIHYGKFLDEGFHAFEREYYEHWLHGNQVVNIEGDSNSKARIQGISMDDGMLVVSELDEHGTRTGKEFKLQADGNSFDFFNGLLRKKI